MHRPKVRGFLTPNIRVSKLKLPTISTNRSQWRSKVLHIMRIQAVVSLANHNPLRGTCPGVLSLSGDW